MTNNNITAEALQEAPYATPKDESELFHLLPDKLEDLSTELMEKALKLGGYLAEQTRITRIHLRPIDKSVQGATSSIFLVDIEYSNESSKTRGAESPSLSNNSLPPKTVLCKVKIKPFKETAKEWQWPLGHHFNSTQWQRECAIYKSGILQDAEVNAPMTYATIADIPNEKYLLVMNVVENITKRNRSFTSGLCGLEDGKLMLTELAKLHAHTWGKKTDLSFGPKYLHEFPILGPHLSDKGDIWFTCTRMLKEANIALMDPFHEIKENPQYNEHYRGSVEIHELFTSICSDNSNSQEDSTTALINDNISSSKSTNNSKTATINSGKNTSSSSTGNNDKTIISNNSSSNMNLVVDRGNHIDLYEKIRNKATNLINFGHVHLPENRCCLIHGDIHMGNWMFSSKIDNDPNGIAILHDFQQSHWGEPTHDVARTILWCTKPEVYCHESYYSSLVDNDASQGGQQNLEQLKQELTVEERQRKEFILIKHYYDTLILENPEILSKHKYTLEECFKDYNDRGKFFHMEFMLSLFAKGDWFEKEYKFGRFTVGKNGKYYKTGPASGSSNGLKLAYARGWASAGIDNVSAFLDKYVPNDTPEERAMLEAHEEEVYIKCREYVANYNKKKEKEAKEEQAKKDKEGNNSKEESKSSKL